MNDNEEIAPPKGPETNSNNVYNSTRLDFRNPRFRCLKILPRRKNPLEREWTDRGFRYYWWDRWVL